MSGQDPINYAAWISALCAGATILGVIIVAVLKSYFVTRAELDKAINVIDKKVDDRHKETGDRLGKQDEALNKINAGVSRIEGQLSGRYPRLQG